MSVIENLLAKCNTPQEKGKLFEAICMSFLSNDRICQSRFSNLWLWRDFPLSENQRDTGIDIVAQRKDNGTYCAIQCKYRSSGQVTKREIDSFLSASSKEIYSERIIISNNHNYGTNAENALSGQNPPCRTLTLAELSRSLHEVFRIKEKTASLKTLNL